MSSLVAGCAGGKGCGDGEAGDKIVALGSLAGSDGGGARWATVCSLIETCRLNQVEPYAYLRDVLQRMIDGHPANRLDELLPWNWALNHGAAA